MSESRITESGNPNPPAAIDEAIWSRVAREAVLFRDSSIDGITRSMKNLQNNPGEPIVAGIAGAVVAAPLLLLSNRYRFISPVLDLLAVGSAVSLASDGMTRLGTVGSAMADYWNHSEHKGAAAKTISANVGPLFFDSVGAYAGFLTGSRYASGFAQRLENTREHYRELDWLARKAKLSKEHPQPEIIVLDDDGYWGARIAKAEKSGWAGVEKSMDWLNKALNGQKE